MAVNIYDASDQAFAEAGGAQIYSSDDSAFVDASGKVWNGSEWVDAWNSDYIITPNGWTSNKGTNWMAQGIPNESGGYSTEAGVLSNDVIDLSKYKYLKVDIKRLSNNGEVRCIAVKTESPYYVTNYFKSVIVSSLGVYTFDISSWTIPSRIGVFGGGGGNLTPIHTFINSGNYGEHQMTNTWVYGAVGYGKLWLTNVA